MPLHGEVVLDLRRLDAPRPGRRARRSGDRAGRRHDRAPAGPRAAPRAGSTASTSAHATAATVGGTIATNAGGVHVLRYGATRRQVIGVEAVFADGRVMRRLDGLEKDNTGYDLAGLLCGSEGTLAVITAARLRLVPRPTHVVVALLAFDDVDAALDAVGDLRRVARLPAGGGAVLPGRPRPRVRPARPAPAVRGAPPRVRAGGSGRDAPTRPTSSPARSTRSPASPTSPSPADDRAARDLWRYREAHTEAINQLGPPHKLDVTLPADQLAGVRRGGPRPGQRRRARRHGLAVRPRGRRQRPRERDRCCSRRRTGDRRGAAPRRATGTDRSAPSTESARPNASGCHTRASSQPRSTRSARSKPRSIPTTCSTRTSCCRPIDDTDDRRHRRHAIALRLDSAVIPARL